MWLLFLIINGPQRFEMPAVYLKFHICPRLEMVLLAVNASGADAWEMQWMAPQAPPIDLTARGMLHQMCPRARRARGLLGCATECHVVMAKCAL